MSWSGMFKIKMQTPLEVHHAKFSRSESNWRRTCTFFFTQENNIRGESCKLTTLWKENAVKHSRKNPLIYPAFMARKIVRAWERSTVSECEKSRKWKIEMPLLIRETWYGRLAAYVGLPDHIRILFSRWWAVDILVSSAFLPTGTNPPTRGYHSLPTHTPSTPRYLHRQTTLFMGYSGSLGFIYGASWIGWLWGAAIWRIHRLPTRVRIRPITDSAVIAEDCRVAQNSHVRVQGSLFGFCDAVFFNQLDFWNGWVGLSTFSQAIYGQQTNWILWHLSVFFSSYVCAYMFMYFLRCPNDYWVMFITIQKRQVCSCGFNAVLHKLLIRKTYTIQISMLACRRVKLTDSCDLSDCQRGCLEIISVRGHEMPNMNSLRSQSYRQATLLSNVRLTGLESIAQNIKNGTRLGWW